MLTEWWDDWLLILGVPLLKPMRRGEYRFRDIVSGEPVHYYYDEDGTRYLATGSRSRMRVPIDDVPLLHTSTQKR